MKANITPDPLAPASARKRRSARSRPGATIPATAPANTPSMTLEALLGQLERCAAECAEVERVLGGRGIPELETIVKLHRLLILRFSLEAGTAPEMLKLVEALMKPVMDWARLEEKRKERELAEQKYRDQLAAGKTGETNAPGALQAATLEKIEQELGLAGGSGGEGC